MDTGRILALNSFCGSDAGQDRLLHPLLLIGRELAHLDVKFPVATKLAKGAHVAHVDELGVL